ncbi:MAG: variant-type mycofactocin precursor [Hyphomicrobium sp.]
MLTETQHAVSTSVADAPLPQNESPAPAVSSAPAALNEAEPAGGRPRILEEVIIEEVSIDGMCGVY